MRHYKTKHFELHELIPRKVYEAKGQLAWKFLDPDALEACDIIRELFGPLTINNWYWNGVYQWSGLRTHESGYSELSAHFRGCAFDLKSKKFSGEQMRKGVISYDAYAMVCITIGHEPVSKTKWKELSKRFFELINEVELDTHTWIHIAKTNRAKFMWIPKPK